MKLQKSVIIAVMVAMFFGSISMGATTYYEIWRNDTNNPNTAERIEEWYEGTDYIDDDPTLEADDQYYYWIRSLTCEEAEDYYYWGAIYLYGKITCPTNATVGYNSPVRVEIEFIDKRFGTGNSNMINCAIKEDDLINNDEILEWNEWGYGPEDDIYLYKVVTKDVNLNKDSTKSDIFLHMWADISEVKTKPTISVNKLSNPVAGPACNASQGTYENEIHISWPSKYVCSEIDATPSSVGWTKAPVSNTLRVNLNPSSAQWRLYKSGYNSDWKSSGSTVSNLDTGGYTLEFSSVSNYITPPSRAITIYTGSNTLNVNYDQNVEDSDKYTYDETNFGLDYDYDDYRVINYSSSFKYPDDFDKICMEVLLEDVYENEDYNPLIEIKCKYYKPDGEFYTDVTWTVDSPRPDYDYWSTYSCYDDDLASYGFENYPGEWTCKVYVNGEGSFDRVDTERFSILRAPAKVTSPNPGNGLTGKPLYSSINWVNGGWATSYDVYFGTDSTPDSGELKGNQSSTSFDPGALEYATTYYWRIDSKNSTGTTTGDVWSFTTVTDTIPPANPSNCSSSPLPEALLLAWNNPSDSDFAGIVILRSKSSLPGSLSAGSSYAVGSSVGNAVVVYNGSAESYQNSGLDPFDQYFYRIYSYDDLKNYSSGVTLIGVPKAQPDITGEGDVNLLDFSKIASYWMTDDCGASNDWCAGADIDHSGGVEMADLNILVENWLNGSSNLNAGLIAYYPLDENANDSSGSGYNGSPTNIRVFEPATPGLSNGCANLTRGDDRIIFDGTLGISQESYSVSMWLKMNTFKSGSIAWNKYDNSDKTAFHIVCTSDNTLQFFRNNYNIGNVGIIETEQLQTQKWYHVVYVIDRQNNVGKAYIDGQLVGSGDISQGGGWGSYTTRMVLGAYATFPQPSNSIDGWIDEFRMYNRLLNDAEVNQLYENEGPSTQYSEKIAIINPDNYRTLKCGAVMSDDTYVSIADGVHADGDNLVGDPGLWSGVGEQEDFIGSMLESAGCEVDYFEASQVSSTTLNSYSVVIVQDPLETNLMLFDKATVDASGLPDLLEYVTNPTFLSAIDGYVQSGGNLVLVGDAVRLLENGSNRLNYGKTVSAISPANTVDQASAWIPPLWLFTRGNPFCGADRDASGVYTVTSGELAPAGTVLSNVAINNRSDLPYSHIWSDTIYKPSDSVSLLDVNFSGLGEYVLDGSTCGPTVYYNVVDETVNAYAGYTVYNGQKIYYMGSDSFFDYNFKDWHGTWHTGESMEIDNAVTLAGKNSIISLLNYIFTQDDSGLVIDPLELVETIIDDFETGDLSAQGWQLSGDANWQVISDNTNSGNYTAQSSDIVDSQSVILSLSLDTTGYETLSFDYKVSSENGYDYLRFYVDGAEITKWSGTIDWATYDYDLSGGTHTFEWKYTKDSSVSSGSDCAWIDDISFTSIE